MQSFRAEFGERWNDVRSSKLGLSSWLGASDDNLWRTMERLLSEEITEHGVDYTVFFSRLGSVEKGDEGEVALRKVGDAFYYNDVEGAVIEPDIINCWTAWFEEYIQRISEEDEGERKEIMSKSNPRIVPRNWMMYEAFTSVGGGDVEDGADLEEEFDPGLLEDTLRAVQSPYEVEVGDDGIDERWFGRTPKEYQNVPGLAFLS